MQEYERKGIYLIVIGGLIGLGNLLVSHEVITPRLIIGRTILGSGSSLVAGTLLLQIPDLNPLALVGFGSALGIIGASAIEAFIKSKFPGTK